MILITEFMDEDAVRAGLDGFDVRYDADPRRPAGGAARGGSRRAARSIVRNRTQVRGDLLAAAGRLRWSAGSASGSTTSTSRPAAARGIAVFPATGANDVSVAEYVIATAMLLLRGAYHATAEVVAGAWPRNRLIGREIGGQAARARRLRLDRPRDARSARARSAWRSWPTIPSCRPTRRPGRSPASGRRSTSTTLLATSDVVSLHVPLTAADARPDRRGGASAAMKPGRRR